MSEESITLHTTSHGESDETVVFLHGLFGQGKNFTQIAKGLQPELASVLVDLPNHGRSEWTRSFDYIGQADLVADHLCHGPAAQGPVHLVGHSMGGKIAMVLALRHPELIKRLVVVDISPAARQSMDEFDHLLTSLENLDLKALRSRADADERLQAPIPQKMVRSFLLQSLARDTEGFRWRSNLALLHSSLPAIGGFPEFDGEQFHGPVLWIAGADSDYVSSKDSPAMRALFPAVRQTTIKNAGHWVHSEQPEIFIQVLRRFLT